MRETREDKLERLTRYERELWEQGYSVAGMDEVGRGPLAGPVVTCCISIPRSRLVPGVDDSKRLSEKRREELFQPLTDAADYCRVAFRDRETIDRINILNATKDAMEESASGFEGAERILLIDAVEGLRLPCLSKSLVHGDAVSYMIGAASVVAKVTRDRYMIELDERYPMYGFRRNKGYGTAEHIRALKEYGPCPEHRRSFLRSILGELDF